MHLDKILLLTDKEDLAFSYELLLGEYGTLDVEVLSSKRKLDEIALQGYGIIIADLHAKGHVREFLEIASFYSFTRELLVLISLFDSSELQKLDISLKNISFIIKKPFITSKLTNFIEKEIYKMKQVSLISNKADILIDIIDLHPSRIAVYDSDGFFFYANLNYMEAYKISVEHDKKLHFDSVASCEYPFSNIKSKLFVLKTLSLQEQEQNSWQESLFFYTNSKYIIHISSDITSKKQKELRLELASNFFENTNEGIIVADKNGFIESVNKAFSTITGYTKEYAIGKNPRILKSGLHDAKFYDAMWNGIKANGYWKGEVWNKRKNGEVYPQILSISKTTSIIHKEEYYMSIFTDISSLKEADKKIYYHANYDSLTTLPNRGYFEKKLEDILKEAEQNETQVAVFFIDVDKFKDVNDTYGHNVGDAMLVSIAKRLLNSTRADDFIARIGGDEFVLVAKDIKNHKNVENLAKKMQKKVQQSLEVDGQIFSMSLSVGIAIYPEHGTKSQELLKHADIAMYEVKENGRAGSQIYASSMSKKIMTKTSMMLEIKRALLHKEFVMHYQPVIDFKNKCVSGVEALVRWNHPQRGIIPPDDFLHYILSSELEREFGDLVIESVFQDIQRFNQVFPDTNLSISINISREHFFTPSFCADIAIMMKKYAVEPSQIELELLEVQIMHNTELAKQNIDNLRLMGFRISLDDFGVEYSSLNYLKRFAVDKLKIDRSFVQNISEDPHDLKIVQSIINIGKLFDLKIQVEGIETLAQYDLLKLHGCDFSQGFYHSHAIGFEEFIGYYRDNYEKSKKWITIK